jgi:hypothetical protein
MAGREVARGQGRDWSGCPAWAGSSHPRAAANANMLKPFIVYCVRSDSPAREDGK